MSYNTPNYQAQGGSQWVIGGTLAAAGAASVSLPAGVTFGGTVSIGGTAGRWAFGSAALTSGTVLIYTGLSQIVSAAITPVTVGNNGTGAGTATSFQVDMSRAANGTVYAFGVTGTFAFTGAGTVLWTAFGY